MTREEAIKALGLMEQIESIVVTYEPGEQMEDTSVHEMKEACHMAVAALRAQPKKLERRPGLEPEDIDALQKRERGLAEMLVNVSCGCVVPYTRLAELVQAKKDGRLVILQPNDPLTLEELREMDGEPVWVEIPNNMVSEWCIAKFDPLMNRVRLWCSGGGWFDGRNVGKSLFVYRRKPKELEGGIEVC